MKKVVTLLLTVLMTVTCCFALVGCQNTSNDEFKFGLICLHGDSSTYDKNFIDAFKVACENKGVKPIIYTDVPEEDACFQKAEDCVDEGCKIVFADSFGHEKFLLKAAKKYPNVTFAHATGTMAHTEKLENFYNGFASIYEGRFLAGIVAGLKLKQMEDENKLVNKNFTNEGAIKIGYVGAWTYAEVVSGYTAWYLGVKEGYKYAGGAKDINMDVQFTGSWYNEPDEKTTAETLIDRGCAIISQHADSMGAPTACETAGVPNVSYNGSTAVNCPKTFLVSSRINWIPYFEALIDSVKNGTKLDTDYTGNITDKSVLLTELGSAATSNAQEVIDLYKTKLLNNEVKVFDCSKFTVTVVQPSGEPGDFGTNTAATVDVNNHLTQYKADVDTDDNYTPDTDVVKTENGITYFAESFFRSAPYFDIKIDGINLLNVKM